MEYLVLCPFPFIRAALALNLKDVVFWQSHCALFPIPVLTANRETCTQPKFFHNGKQNRTRGRISPPPRSMG